MKGIERNAFIKVLLLMIFTSGAIFSLAKGGSYAYENFFSFENRLPTHAMIGSVTVGGMKESEAKETVGSHIEDWKQKATIELHMFDQSVNIPPDEIQFDIDESVRVAFNEGYANFISTVRLATLEEKIKELPFANIIHSVSLQKLQKGIEEQLYTLTNETVMLDLNEYFIEEEKLIPQTVASVTKYVPEKNYLSTWVDALDGAIIPQHTLFSLLETLEQSGISPFKSEELNIVASMMYELLLQTNFTVVERHIGRVVPDYTEIGFDAIVLPNEADLKFLNVNVYDYEIRTIYENNQLTIELYGIPFLYTYEIVVEEERVAPRKIVHFSSRRSLGDVQTIRYGQDGYLVNVTKIVRNQNNEFVEEIDISEDYYPPVHQIEERSLYVPPIDDEDQDEMVDETEDESFIDEFDEIEEEPINDDESMYEDPMFNRSNIDEPIEEKPIIDDPFEEPPTQKN